MHAMPFQITFTHKCCVSLFVTLRLGCGVALQESEAWHCAIVRHGGRWDLNFPMIGERSRSNSLRYKNIV